MRSLKFRAWFKRFGKMIYEVDKNFLDLWKGYFENSQIHIVYPDDGDVIEQYTGLKDKNGKEIYEGDIILVANQGRTPYVVIFREGDCSFVACNENMLDYTHLFSGMPQCYKVIGNIHENPELLNLAEDY